MLLFDLSTKQKELEELDYWEMGILDLKISYFGDEVSLCIEDYHNKEKYWEIKFLVCAKVEYSIFICQRENFGNLNLQACAIRKFNIPIIKIERLDKA